MVFYWSMSDSKSPQVTRTHLSILTDRNNAIALISLPFSNSSSPISMRLWTVPCAPITIGVTVSLIFHSFLGSLARSKYFSIFSLSLTFNQWSAGMTKSTFRLVLFFLLGLVFYLLLGLVFRLMFCLYVKFPEEFMCFVILDGFWFVYKLYGSILKFQFLAQFPLDHHSHPIASSLRVIIIIMSCR